MSGKNVVRVYKDEKDKGTVIGRYADQGQAVKKMNTLQFILGPLGFKTWDVKNEGRETWIVPRK